MVVFFCQDGYIFVSITVTSDIFKIKYHSEHSPAYVGNLWVQGNYLK